MDYERFRLSREQAAQIRPVAIGGSEVAATVNAHPWIRPVELWARKQGFLPPAEPTERMLWGLSVQHALLDFACRMGIRAEWVDEPFYDPARPFMIASPDGLVPAENAGLEVKIASQFDADEWGPEIDDVPVYYYYQAAWYMAFFDMDRWYFCVLIGGTPQIYCVDRDREGVEQPLVQIAERWVDRHLIRGERPPLDDSMGTRNYLRRRYPENRRKIRMADEQEALLLADYEAVRLNQQALEKARRELEHKLCDSIQDYDGIETDQRKFTWKKTRDGKAVDHKSMSVALLYDFIKDPEERDALTAQYTSLKPGYRRIYFKSKAWIETPQSEETAA